MLPVVFSSTAGIACLEERVRSDARLHEHAAI